MASTPIRRGALTLIELLIAVAIIGVLAALLIPSAMLVRGQAHSITCLSNLRQLGMAHEAYSQDWEGFWPPTKQNASEGGGGPLAGSFFPLIRGYLMKGHGRNQGVYHCPASWMRLATEEELAKFGPSEVGVTVSFGHNHTMNLFSGRAWWTLSPDHLYRPSQTILMADKWGVGPAPDYRISPHSWVSPPYKPADRVRYTWADPGNALSLRANHPGNTANFLFYDLRVQRLKPDQTYDPLWPGAQWQSPTNMWANAP